LTAAKFKPLVFSVSGFALSNVANRPGGPGYRIYILRNRVAWFYPQALGSLSFALYGSQGKVRERAKTVHALDRAATVIATLCIMHIRK
jgi:hypothetical protein